MDFQFVLIMMKIHHRLLRDQKKLRALYVNINHENEKSIFISLFSQYTRPIDDDSNQSNSSVVMNGDKSKRKQLSDDEIYAKLRLIVSHGDPNKKYRSKDKIGQG